MNTNWYLNQELAAAHRRDLVATFGYRSPRRAPSRRWKLPRVIIRSLRAPRPVVARGECP